MFRLGKHGQKLEATREGSLEKSEEWTVLVVRKKKNVPGLLLQPAPETKPYTTSTAHSCDEFLNYAVKTEMMDERSESIRTVGKNGKCVENVTERYAAETVNEADTE